MKKYLFLVAAGILTSASVLAAINWNAGTVENIAKGSSVTVSSKDVEAVNITDNNDGTGWQAVAATHTTTADWVIIDLGEKKQFTDIEIIWEASHCKGYSVYVSDSEIPYETTTTEGGVECRVISPEWLEANTPAVTGGDSSEANYTENLTLDQPGNGRYILIYANDYNNFGNNYGMRIFEVRVANIEGRDEISEIRIAQEGNAVAEGDPVTITVAPFNKTGDKLALDALENITLDCDNTDVTIENVADGSFAVSASTHGAFTLKASATVSATGETLTAMWQLNVAYNWSKVENIATGKAIVGRVKTADGATVDNPAGNAVDGLTDTYYEYNGEWGGGDGWLLVDLGDEYIINAVGAYYSGATAAGQCVFGYAADATAIYEKIEAEGTDYVWNAALPVNDGWTFTGNIARVRDAVTTYTYDNPVVARYVVVKDADNPGGKPCVNEIYISGVKRAASEASKIEVTTDNNYLATGEAATLSARVFDQFNMEMTDAEVAFSCLDGSAVLEGNRFSATAIGEYVVTASCGDLSADIVISVVAESRYQLNDQLSNEVSLNGVTLDGKNPFAAGNEIQIAELPATLEINFDEPRSFTLLKIRWEAACPSDYTVEATYANGTKATVLTVSGRGFVGGYNPVDKIVATPRSRAAEGVDLTQVKTLTFNITAKGHQYDLRLFGIDGYAPDNSTSGIDQLNPDADSNAPVDVYNLQGVRIRTGVMPADALTGLPRGIYIVGGRKVLYR